MKRVFVVLSAFVFATLALASDASAQDYKIKQAVTMGGQKMTSTTYVKGSRKRTETGAMMGMGGDVADIEQCDLKRNLKISDKKKKYVVEPFTTGDSPASSPAPGAKTPVTRGGTITYISNIVDTGERKQMFGMTARRLKTTMKIESSPDACAQSNMSMESDGWYIDLPTFSCPMEIRNVAPPQPETGGCRDRVVARNTGAGKLGFPLMETRTMNSSGQAFTYTTETLEFTTTPLLASLFDIPAGYTAASSTSELYGAPDMAEMMRAAQAQSDAEGSQPANTASPAPAQPAATGAKRPGVIRIGVLPPTNRGESVSVAGMQAFMAQKLTAGNTEGLAVASEADARAAECDYILSSDFSKLKQSTASKIGGMFGKVTNTDTSGTKSYEAQVDFKLIKVADGKSVLQNKASGKGEGDASRAAEGVLATAAGMVLAAAK